MELLLTPQEHELLQKILEQHHLELQKEISHTDHREFKQTLHNNEKLPSSPCSAVCGERSRRKHRDYVAACGLFLHRQAIRLGKHADLGGCLEHLQRSAQVHVLRNVLRNVEAKL
jgi:hypothetical protein